MSTEWNSRRDFLKRFAQRAGYAVPVVLTLAAPAALSAQAAASQKMGGMAMGMMMAMLVAPLSPSLGPNSVGASPPWAVDPPGAGG